MTRLLAIGAALAAVLYVLNDTGTVRISGGGGSGSGGFSGYTGASKPAIGAIAGAAG